MSDFIIEHSPMLGGWCVYEQVAYADYTRRDGPFESQGEAEAALEARIEPEAHSHYCCARCCLPLLCSTCTCKG